MYWPRPAGSPKLPGSLSALSVHAPSSKIPFRGHRVDGINPRVPLKGSIRVPLRGCFRGSIGFRVWGYDINPAIP